MDPATCAKMTVWGGFTATIKARFFLKTSHTVIFAHRHLRTKLRRSIEIKAISLLSQTKKLLN